MEIISRAQWGARHDDGFGSAPVPASEVWLHHSVTIAPDLVPPFDDEDQAMRILEDIGEARFGRGISYTFAAMPTGRLYQGHGIDRQGAHTGGRNSIARAIVLVGNYDVAEVSGAQVESIAQLLVDGWRRGYWIAPRLNGGHQQAPDASTACPGRYGMAAIPLINARAAVLAGTSPEEDEMASADVQKLLAITNATNRAVAHMRVVVADPRTGLGVRVANLQGQLGVLTAAVGEIGGDVDDILAKAEAAGEQAADEARVELEQLFTQLDADTD